MSRARTSDINHIAWLNSFVSANFLQNKLSLDLGCGSGFFCQFASEQSSKPSFGIDLIKPLKNNSWQFIEENLDSSSWHESVKPYLEGKKLDVITAFDLIEHVESPYRLLKSSYDLLENNGQVILTTPNTLSWERLMRPQNWSGAKDPQHKTLFHSYSLTYLLQKTGFKVKLLKAPLRSFGPLKWKLPQIGGQLFCLAEKKEE